MAIRLLQAPKTEEVEKKFIAKSFGIVGLMIGVVSLFWAMFWQPEIGGFVERGRFFIDQLFSNRVMFAFGIDIVLFYCFQIWLMGAIIPKEFQQRNLRFFPLFGLGLWLIL